MQENIFKFKFVNYWRNVDKEIFFCFIILFFLGLFFSFSSTSSLAGERLNKDYYFFFSKHLIFWLSNSIPLMGFVLIPILLRELFIKLVCEKFEAKLGVNIKGIPESKEK